MDLLVRVALGFGVAVLCTPAGVSGAFLLLPLQVQVLGVPSPAVSATNLVYNVVSAPAGVVSYARAGGLDRTLAGLLCAGTVPGVIAGVLIRATWLAGAGRFGVVAGILLVLLGLRTAVTGFGRARTGADRDTLPSWWRLLTLGLVAGVVGGVYGIGGAAIAVPWLTTVERLPVSRVAGAGLVITLVTSVVGLVTFAVAAGLDVGRASTPAWIDGLALGVGGAVGAVVGARLQPRLPRMWLRLLLGVAGLAAGLRMFVA